MRRFNLTGLWRVLLVFFVGVALVTGYSAVRDAHNESLCPERQQDEIAALEKWERLPLRDLDIEGRRCAANGHCEFKPLANYARACRPPLRAVGLGGLWIAAEFCLMFGGGLIIRWMYRGFVSPAA